MNYLHTDLKIRQILPSLAVLLCLPIISSCVTINTATTASTTTPSTSTQSPPTSQTAGAGGTLTIEQPFPDERFVQGEPVKLSIRAGRDGLQVKWTSNIDGTLGTGDSIEVKSLSAGIHQLNVSNGSSKGTLQVRVFKDLTQLYQSKMTTDEINRIRSDFNINWMSGSDYGERWGGDSSYEFDQKSPDPSRIAALSKIDLLRHQKFSQPLPFTGGATAYENLKTYVKQINLRLDCSISTAGNRTVNLNRGFSVWDLRQSGTQQNPDACKMPLQQPIVLADYINSIYLLLHEARHCETSDPGHLSCKGNDNMDQKLEGGSGHATATLYLIWVYKYGLYDSPQIKENARLTALSILQNRFCTTPKHSNPQAQSILNELGIK